LRPLAEQGQSRLHGQAVLTYLFLREQNHIIGVLTDKAEKT